jgi:hypothetical protein
MYIYNIIAKTTSNYHMPISQKNGTKNNIVISKLIKK